MKNLRLSIATLAVLIAGSPGLVLAQNYRLVAEELDANRHGYTVLHVWGTPEEMGFAMGAAIAEDLVLAMDQVRAYLGGSYNMARIAASALDWPDPAVEAEMDAIVEGVRSVLPEADVDGGDIRLVNALSDLPYTMCRSHSAWGRFVEAPVRTLSTRRFDYGAVVDFMHHHFIVAMEPDDGPAWVNVGWGSVVTVITGVNEHGTVVGLHDLGRGDLMLAAPVARSAAARYVLTRVGEVPIEEHAAWAASQIGEMEVVTDTFILYYVPEGHGGMFTCLDQSCELLRPQADFLFGEAVITTNTVTDWHGTPVGGEWLADYYADGQPKTLESHWQVTGESFHRLSVEYRGRGDMTLWFDGTLRRGSTPRVALEWSELFEGGGGDGDGDADADAEPPDDGGAEADSGPEPAPGRSRGCAVAGPAARPGAARLARALLGLAG